MVWGIGGDAGSLSCHYVKVRNFLTSLSHWGLVLPWLRPGGVRLFLILAALAKKETTPAIQSAELIEAESKSRQKRLLGGVLAQIQRLALVYSFAW
jgi:hypothetical protein